MKRITALQDLLAGADLEIDADGRPVKVSQVGHTHRRLDSALGYLTLDAAGGLQHGTGGTRRFWVDDTGTLREGTVPWERITGAPPAPSPDSWDAAITALHAAAA